MDITKGPNILSYEIPNGVIDFEEAFRDFEFPSNFDRNKEESLKNDLIQQIVGNNTNDMYDRIKNRIQSFNLAEKIQCEVSTARIQRTEKTRESEEIEAPIYYNYIIGKVANKLYLRVGMLSNKDIKKYFSERSQSQMEWSAGLKHLILCRGIKILFSGVLIYNVNENKILITPSSGQWAEIMYLLINSDRTKNEATNGLTQAKNTDVKQFYRELNNSSELKQKIAELNCLNIVATFYALKTKQDKMQTGGVIQEHELVSIPIDPDITFDTKCFGEYYDSAPSKECNEDGPFLKSSDTKLVDDIIRIIKNNSDYNGPIIEILIKIGSKDGIKDYLKDFSTNQDLLNEIEAIKTWNQKRDEPLLLRKINEPRYEVNTKITFEDILRMEGGIKKAQTYFVAINKRLNELNKRKLADSINMIHSFIN